MLYFHHDQMSGFFPLLTEKCVGLTLGTPPCKPSLCSLLLRTDLLCTKTRLWLVIQLYEYSQLFIYLLILMNVVSQPLRWEHGISHRFQYISASAGKRAFICHLGSGYLKADYLGENNMVPYSILQSERFRDDKNPLMISFPFRNSKKKQKKACHCFRMCRV